jgi:hypothetical protein
MIEMLYSYNLTPLDRQERRPEDVQLIGVERNRHPNLLIRQFQTKVRSQTREEPDDQPDKAAKNRSGTHETPAGRQ